MLRFPEEILLLLLDDESGKMSGLRDWSLKYALTGAVLMDLALEGRIDSDLQHMVLVDSTPLNDDLLDPLLAEIAADKELHAVRFWLEKLSSHAKDIQERALERLVSNGILKRQEDLFLWVFKSRSYPTLDGKAEREVKLRILEILFSDIIPGPRDVVIICLADACGVFSSILSERELEYCRARIEQVRRLDLIGQAVLKAIWDIDAQVAYAVQPQGL